MGHLSAAGANATALRPGIETVSLKVTDSHSNVIGEASATLNVLKNCWHEHSCGSEIRENAIVLMAPSSQYHFPREQ